MDLKVSKIFAKDLISGRSKYIVEFDTIKIGTDFPGRTCIEFYLKGTLLASTITDAQIGPFSTFTFVLEEGNMKISLKNEPSTGDTSRERIKVAIAEIIKELDAEEEIL